MAVVRRPSWMTIAILIVGALTILGVLFVRLLTPKAEALLHKHQQELSEQQLLAHCQSDPKSDQRCPALLKQQAEQAAVQSLGLK